MAIILASIGNLAAGAAHAVAVRPISAEAIYWPAWILVGGVLIALLIVIGVLASLKAALLAKPRKRDEEFTRMLCKQVWKHTATVTDIFAQRLRQPQRDLVTLRVLLRLLREDIAGPVNFVEQMRPHAPATWPDYELFAAFNNWGGQICAMESQLADMQQMLSYPAVKEPVDAHRDAMLVHFYATEQVAMGQTVSTLGNHAIAVCEAAKKVLKKAPGGFRFGGGDHDPDEQDHGCPACGASQHGVYAGANARDLLPLPALPDLPEKPKKKEEAKPAAQICGCATPRPCRCAPVPCACACSCKTASAPAPAHP
ncbi:MULTISPECIES: hypothetical protein [unclassified Sphingomonas]|uniref:hypothetical protein n=1 Tax=Sphingomonas TaxID=13687 RepID=UPI00095B09BE|nr:MULTISPECIES: hypothetical protein [unclassified Sphingomonas]MBN8811312.1 hypothetical protein [Sphingomonas sp.]OJY53221.1 MAG: hypothetical protein BGP17_10995 [Sphingomonas sp. 67-41]